MKLSHLDDSLLSKLTLRRANAAYSSDSGQKLGSLSDRLAAHAAKLTAPQGAADDAAKVSLSSTTSALRESAAYGRAPYSPGSRAPGSPLPTPVAPRPRTITTPQAPPQASQPTPVAPPSIPTAGQYEGGVSKANNTIGQYHTTSGGNVAFSHGEVQGYLTPTGQAYGFDRSGAVYSFTVGLKNGEFSTSNHTRLDNQGAAPLDTWERELPFKDGTIDLGGLTLAIGQDGRLTATTKGPDGSVKPAGEGFMRNGVGFIGTANGTSYTFRYDTTESSVRIGAVTPIV